MPLDTKRPHAPNDICVTVEAKTINCFLAYVALLPKLFWDCRWSILSSSKDDKAKTWNKSFKNFVVLGGVGVGKSCITSCFVRDSFMRMMSFTIFQLRMMKTPIQFNNFNTLLENHTIHGRYFPHLTRFLCSNLQKRILIILKLGLLKIATLWTWFSQTSGKLEYFSLMVLSKDTSKDWPNT